MLPEEFKEPVAIPVTAELDLHTFQPRDVAQLLRDYFPLCVLRGIFRVRVIHGKGTGALRETVHSQLRRSPEVAGFALAEGNSGGWGATWVTLRRPDSK